MKVLVSPVNLQGRKAPGSTAHRGEKNVWGGGFKHCSTDLWTPLEQHVDYSNIYSYAGVVAVAVTFQLSDQHMLKYADFPSQGMFAYTWVRRSDIQKKLAELLLA